MKNCEICKQLFIPKHKVSRFCSIACRRKGVAILITKRKICICKNCGKEFWPKSTKVKDFCGRPCYYAHHSENKKLPIIKVKIELCLYCDNFVTSPIKVCKECKQNQWKRQYEITSGYKSGICTCVRCGKQFSKDKRATKCLYCSNRCQNAAQQQRKRARIIIDNNEPMTLSERIQLSYKRRYEIQKHFKEKNQYCGICGMLIDMNLNHPHLYSFTVDHVIPLANGGSDDLTNLQPAHLICNSTKGNRVSVL